MQRDQLNRASPGLSFAMPITFRLRPQPSPEQIRDPA